MASHFLLSRRWREAVHWCDSENSSQWLPAFYMLHLTCFIRSIHLTLTPLLLHVCLKSLAENVYLCGWSDFSGAYWSFLKLGCGEDKLLWSVLMESTFSNHFETTCGHIRIRLLSLQTTVNRIKCVVRPLLETGHTLIHSFLFFLYWVHYSLLKKDLILKINNNNLQYLYTVLCHMHYNKIRLVR